MATLRKNEVGVPIRINTGLDLTSATDKKLLIRKPRGAFVEWTNVTIDGTYITHVTEAGDLDQTGEYRIVAHVEFVGGVQRMGSTARLTVEDVFDG